MQFFAGIDEAGRGCLAGPVAAAAVILNPEKPIPGLADSKQLKPGKREHLANQIRKNALAFSVALVWQDRIDKINILAATLEAMARAASFLKVKPHILEIDGNKAIPAQILKYEWEKRKNEQPVPAQECIINGDAKIPAISAASIIAKTFRDSLMRAFAKKWPLYGFEHHKGYGTAAHLEALRKFGPCPLHRISFRGVKPEQLPLIS